MRLNALIGTVGISFSAVLVRLVDLPPAVTSFGRNAYALPMLVALALLLRRPSLRPLRPLGWLTGVVFGVNLYLWHSSIDLIGSGFATVLANTQVAFIALLGWLLLKERPRAYVLAVLPLLAVGIWLISGAGQAGSQGSDPVLGALFGVASGLSSATYVLLFRYSSKRLPEGSDVGFLLHVSLGGALAAGLLAGADGAAAFQSAGPAAHAWLVVLAVVAQVGGWLFLSRALRELPAIETAVIMLLQPVLALAWGALVFGERAAGVQVAGVAVVLACVSFLSLLGARRGSVAPANPDNPLPTSAPPERTAP